MNVICIAVGDCFLGRTTTDKNGNQTSVTARWETNPNGGSVAVWLADADTMEQSAPAEIFGGLGC